MRLLLAAVALTVLAGTVQAADPHDIDEYPHYRQLALKYTTEPVTVLFKNNDIIDWWTGERIGGYSKVNGNWVIDFWLIIDGEEHLFVGIWSNVTNRWEVFEIYGGYVWPNAGYIF